MKHGKVKIEVMPLDNGTILLQVDDQWHVIMSKLGALELAELLKVAATYGDNPAA